MKNIKKVLIIPALLLFVVIALVGCKGTTTTIDDTPKELNTDLTDKTKLDLSYEGKVFQTDRIGEVTLDKCTDGDTADFISNGEKITVRFHAVDTPETKGELQPWGKPASNFTCNALTNAKTIVLEGRNILNDTYGRFLAYVWYDNRLLNLELVEQAYSNATETSDERYGDLFQQAENHARLTKRRIYGDEQDPTYCYTQVETTLKDLRINIDDYQGCSVKVTGVVTKQMGSNAFIEEDGYGIFIYTNHNGTSRLTVGNKVEVIGTVSDYNGNTELIGVSRLTVEVIEEGRNDLIIPQTITIPNVSNRYLGALVKINNLEITSTYSASNNAININVKDASGNTIKVRIDAVVSYKFDTNQFNVGDIIDVIAPVSKYNEQFQLMLCDRNDITIYE